MNQLFEVNHNIHSYEKVYLYGDTKYVQRIFCALVQMGQPIDGFIKQTAKFPLLFGREVLNMMQLMEQKSWCLIVPFDIYEPLLKKYQEIGLKKENLFVWTEPVNDDEMIIL